MFNISDATSIDSINQLINSYNNSSHEEYSHNLISVLNLWYFTAEVDNLKVNCIAYYIYRVNNIYYIYGTSYFVYDTITGLYDYQIGTENYATNSDNKLSPEILEQLTLYYTNTIKLFNISDAVSTDSINQLINSYNNSWNGRYKLTSILNLWYFTREVDDLRVYCIGYYIYYNNNDYNYYNSEFIYDRITGLYDYQFRSGHKASQSDNGLSPYELEELTLYYTNNNPFIIPVSDENLESSLSNINLDFSKIKIQKSYEIPLSGLWNSIKISGDALYQIACQSSENGQVFISNNYGLQWKVVQYFTDNGYLGNFADVAISKDGKYMTVIQKNGYIAISDNYGITWRIIKNCLSKTDNGNVIFNMLQNWYSIDMSGDGKYQTAVSLRDALNNGGYIYRSDNYGTAWTDFTPSIPYPHSFLSISMSYSGKYQSIIISEYYSSEMERYDSAFITSENYGLNWTAYNEIIIYNLYLYNCNVNKSLDTTIDGKYQYVTSGSNGSGINISNDYGQTWNFISFNNGEYSYNNIIFSIKSSSDGKNVYLSTYNRDVSCNAIFISNDYGETWPIIYSNISNNFSLNYEYLNIFKIDTSSNGSFITFTNYDNKILFSNNYGETFNDYNDSPILKNIYPPKCSSSGEYQISFVPNNYIIYSNNYGSTWNKINIIDNWRSCAISLTGQYQSCINNNGLLYISNDYGKTWNYSINLIVGDIVKVSGDGKFYSVLATLNLKYPDKILQVSSDYGKTFTDILNENPLNGFNLFYSPYTIEISLSGQYQVIIDSGISIQVSNDYCNNFSSNYAINENYAYLISGINNISMSANGKFQLLVNNTQPLFYITSDDYGKTFKSYKQVRNDIVSVGNCCISSTGQYQFMSLKTNPNYYIYYSSDYANTWNEMDTSEINYSCQIASVSSNGQSIILSNQNSIYQIYLNSIVK